MIKSNLLSERVRYTLPETEEEIDKVLSDNDVQVTHNYPVPEVSTWCLTWKHGFIGMGYGENQESKARLKSAVFVVLWNHGLDVANADRMSSFWAEKLG